VAPNRSRFGREGPEVPWRHRRMKPRLTPLLAVVVLSSLAACDVEDAPDEVALASSEAALTAGNYAFGAFGATGKCLDVASSGTADGTNIREWTCNNTNAQSFRAEAVAGGTRLVNASSGKCVDVNANGFADRTNVQLWTCNNTAAQTFRLDDAGGGNVRLVHVASGKCVDIDAAGTADGTNVQLYACNGTGAQLWRSSGRARTVRIMPLGASITQGVGGTHAGYRGPLGTLLNQHGIAYQLVGSSTENPGPLAVDQRHHEGHPGYVITAGTSGRPGITDNLAAWLGPNGADPDYILVLVGSNDVDLNYQLDHAGDRMSTLISMISNRTTGLRPNAKLLVATLPLINDPNTEARSVVFNSTISAVVAQHRAAGENVAIVDVHAVITSADKTDNLHPNDAGYDKIAAAWYAAITHP
jgi:lysophospholipase L1-like esterase